MNSFGRRLIMTTFGESHGKAIGCILDGVPAGLVIDETYIQAQLDRRRPGRNEFDTARKEGDKVEILSGVFEGRATGTPIAMVIYNTDQKSGDYDNVKNLFRPGHADFTYFHKYGFRDYRGGGRSSARETAARVAAGAVAKLMLQELGISVHSGICQIGDLATTTYNFDHVRQSPIYAIDPACDMRWQEMIKEAKNSHDSIGGVAYVCIKGAPAGLGEPLYYKLDALLADAMMGINGVKGIEIGEGMGAATRHGSTNNDTLSHQGFATNHAGGTLGGISSGQDITLKVAFKPTPSIFISQPTLTTDGQEITASLKGRHDPCIAVRGSVVAEAMGALVIADMLLLNMGRKMDDLKKVY